MAKVGEKTNKGVLMGWVIFGVVCFMLLVAAVLFASGSETKAINGLKRYVQETLMGKLQEVKADNFRLREDFKPVEERVAFLDKYRQNHNERFVGVEAMCKKGLDEDNALRADLQQLTTQWDEVQRKMGLMQLTIDQLNEDLAGAERMAQEARDMVHATRVEAARSRTMAGPREPIKHEFLPITVLVEEVKSKKIASVKLPPAQKTSTKTTAITKQ